MKQAMRAFVERQCQARLEKLEQAFDQAVKTPGDPESIHDVRVAIRRFTQCLRTFEDVLGKAESRRVRRKLARLMDRCAAARNCDIALELMDAAGVKDAGSRTWLAQQREAAQERLTKYLTRPSRKQRFADWRDELRAGAGRKPWDTRKSVEENAREVLPALAAEFFAAGDRARAEGSSHHDLHRFRLLGKRFRYTLELFDEVYGEELQKRLQALKGLQDRLGAINDCVTSIELLRGQERAAKAVAGLLTQREAEFHRYAATHLSATMAASWRSWLAEKEAK